MSISSPDRGFVENLDYIELYHKKEKLSLWVGGDYSSLHLYS